MQPYSSYGSFFHFHPLALGFKEKVADIYAESFVTPVCPSTTRWTAHDRACKSLCEGYKQFLHALGVCVNERSEPQVTRIFAEITDSTFITTILVLRDVFKAVQPLNLVLQKGDGWFTLPSRCPNLPQQDPARIKKFRKCRLSQVVPGKKFQ